MSAQETPLPYMRRLHDFERLLETAQQVITAQLEAFAREGKMHLADARAQQLASVQQTIAQLGVTITPVATELVREAYEQGAAKAAEQIAGISIDAPEVAGAFNGVSQPAVEALQRSLTMRLDDAMQTLGRRIEDVYAREQRRVALHAVLGAQPSPGAASKELQARLLEDRHVAAIVREGGTGFVDRSGRQWPLDAYSKMATRTVTREAVVHGAMARMVSHGISIARVSTHADSCDICAPYQGTLVSLGGEASEWKGEAVSDGGEIPPFHPNCEHSLAPVATGIEELAAEMGVT